ncbi:MAG TPA: hypothetical protein VFJ51_06285 [Nitrososphaeraceae archaeon]|nr:hypothetical protein [Nitrososphaeraceae archaeon]
MVSSETIGSVIYECMRSGTTVTVEELSRLPEMKCICGFRVFRKSRQPIVKQLKAV